MSLPKFPETPPSFTREDVINQILSSIAMEELGLSHIINAEGEKLQYALGTLTGVPALEKPATLEDLLKINESIRDTLDSTMQNQMFLKAKMQYALTADVKPQGTFLSSYMEASADGQTVPRDAYIVFAPDSINSVGSSITLNPDGTVFTIRRTGLYRIEWNMNLISEGSGDESAVVGIIENGEPASRASCASKGNFSSGTVINVDTVPFTVSLYNFNNRITLDNPVQWEHTAASIRIVRFADGPST